MIGCPPEANALHITQSQLTVRHLLTSHILRIAWHFISMSLRKSNADFPANQALNQNADP